MTGVKYCKWCNCYHKPGDSLVKHKENRKKAQIILCETCGENTVMALCMCERKALEEALNDS